jgi:hypothetical protein
MTDFHALATRYIDTWNEADPAARRDAVTELWADGARYTDPLVDAQGWTAIDATIAAAQQQFPGFSFRLTGAVDGHHDQCRFSWEFGPAGVRAPVAGSDVALVTEDGRLQAVLGSLDRVPVS